MRRRGAVAAFAIVLGVATGCHSGGDHDATTSVPAAVTTTTPLSLASVGCRADTGAQSGILRLRVTVDGAVHPYLLEIPNGYDGGRPAPMVLLFHGFGSSGAEFADLTRLPAKAAARGVVVVTPDGPNHTWQLNGTGTDAAFVDRIIATTEGALCIDRHRVYAAGFSQGAAFSIFYACAHEDAVTAIATVAVDFQLGCTRPMSLLAFHGTADPAVPYNNGAVGASLPGVHVRGTRLNLGDWARLDRCRAAPNTVVLGSEVKRSTWDGCTAGTSLQLYTIIGGGHTWPGADPKKSFMHTTEQIDATTLMLDFFAAR